MDGDSDFTRQDFTSQSASDVSRLLIPYHREQPYPSAEAVDGIGSSCPHMTAKRPIFIIPGTSAQQDIILSQNCPRQYRMQIVIIMITVVTTMGILWGVTPLNRSFAGHISSLAAFANFFGIPRQETEFHYRVQSGDTFEKIASRFHVSVNGIYKLNHFYATQELRIGQDLLISTDQNYGADYMPPPMPVPTVDSRTNSKGDCLFCAHAGLNNGIGNYCASGSMKKPIDVSQFDLLPPLEGGIWVRGFRWDHNGVDITTHTIGFPVHAAQEGMVIFAGWDPFGGGNSVKVNLCGGLSISYSHMEKLLVQVGQNVHAGDVVGLQGSTGNSTGPHVHLMTWWYNQPFDPLCAYPSLGNVSSSTHYGGCPAPR
jgi:LysM repeat protein